MKVLITGVTGYIGGTVLSHILSSPSSATQELQISVLTRNDERAQYFSSAGLKVYTIESLDDTVAISAAASENDIIIHTASGYHPKSAKALIEGLGKRKRQAPGTMVYFIHTSGTSNLADRPVTGARLESRTFSDLDSDIFAYSNRLEESEPYAQRTTDLVVINTGKTENVPTTIIMSPTIYGLGTGHFNRLTIQCPRQIKASYTVGKAEYVGDGAGVWDFVHVLDLARLYELVMLDWIEGSRQVPVGEKGFVFSGTGTFRWKEVAERIASTGVELGFFSTADTRSIGLKEAAMKWTNGDEQLCELGFASNARTRADVAQLLEWRPRKTKKDWEQSFLAEFREAIGIKG